MKLERIAFKDRPLFERYVKLSKHELSVYAFENVYPWKGLFSIRWGLVRDCLCVFFQDSIGCFLYLPPLGRKIDQCVLKEVFSVMDEYNKNKDISRIENVELSQLDAFRKFGLRYTQKPPEYICSRNEMAKLCGNKFKHKRACVNYFLKHHTYEYLVLTHALRKDCIVLYKQWMDNRKAQSQDPVYRGMLDDSYVTLKETLKSWRSLGMEGRVVKINGNTKAFTFGFPLNKDIFCVFYEVTDLEVKGLSQFIFQKFCAELKGYRYINVMDDSGLENLKKVKLSYHPAKIIPNYIITRN